MWRRWIALVASAAVSAAISWRLTRYLTPPPPFETALFFDNDSHTCGNLEGLRCDDAACSFHRLMRIVEAIRSAVRTVDLCQYIVSSPRLASALAEARARGLRVRAILDHDMAFNSGSKAFRMLDDGIPVRTMSSVGLMHHKFCLIDAAEGGLLITGSMNWTNQASFANWENFIMTSSPGLVRPFFDEFERLWGRFPDLTLAGAL